MCQSLLLWSLFDVMFNTMRCQCRCFKKRLTKISSRWTVKLLANCLRTISFPIEQIFHLVSHRRFRRYQMRISIVLKIPLFSTPLDSKAWKLSFRTTMALYLLSVVLSYHCYCTCIFKFCHSKYTYAAKGAKSKISRPRTISCKFSTVQYTPELRYYVHYQIFA